MQLGGIDTLTNKEIIVFLRKELIALNNYFNDSQCYLLPFASVPFRSS